MGMTDARGAVLTRALPDARGSERARYRRPR